MNSKYKLITYSRVSRFDASSYGSKSKVILLVGADGLRDIAFLDTSILAHVKIHLTFLAIKLASIIS
jgi:hypothetical protein